MRVLPACTYCSRASQPHQLLAATHPLQLLLAALLVVAMSSCQQCGNELILQNEFMRIGVDTSRGGAICHLSRTSDGINLLNAYDCGRFIQQSYYGREDGSDWNGQPWKWNPVQGGSWQNQPANVHKCCAEGGALVTVVNPRNWAGGA